MGLFRVFALCAMVLFDVPLHCLHYFLLDDQWRRPRMGDLTLR